MERMNRHPLKRIVQESTNFHEEEFEPDDIEVSPPKRSIQVITEIPIEFESCGEERIIGDEERPPIHHKNDDDTDEDECDDPDDEDWKISSQPTKRSISAREPVILKKPITPIVNRKPYQARAPRVIRNDAPEISTTDPQVDPLATETTANSKPPVNTRPISVEVSVDTTATSKQSVDLRRVVENSSKKPQINRFPCGYCDTVFTDSSFLERHHKRCKAKRAHDSAKSPGTSRPVVPPQIISLTEQQNNRNTAQSRRKSYNCPECNFSTKNPDHLKYHMPKHADVKPLSCNECDFTSRKSDLLDMHKKTAHPKSKDPPEQNDNSKQNENDATPADQTADSSQLFSCDQCSYTSIRSGYLSMHKRIHSRGEPLVCDDCGYKCSRISYFKKHRLTHAGEIPILCDMCSFTCTRLGRMEAHKLTHMPQELSIEYSPDD